MTSLICSFVCCGFVTDFQRGRMLGHMRFTCQEHMSRFYEIGLSFDKTHFTCIWVDLDVFNTSKNCVSRPSVEDMQVCPRFKLKKCCSLKLDSQLSIELKNLFQPRGLTAARQHLDRQVSVKLYEKQNSSYVLTPIRFYVFGLSFLTTLDI